MNKFFVLLACLVITLGTVACSNDDNRVDIKHYPTAIKGVWEESKITYLDQNKKSIKQIDAFNIHNCPLTRIEFNDDQYLEHYFYQYEHHTSCQEGVKKHTFTLNDNTIETTFVGDDYIEKVEYEIVKLTETTLILQCEAIWYDKDVEGAYLMKITYNKK